MAADRRQSLCSLVLLAGLVVAPVTSAGAQALSFAAAPPNSAVMPQYAPQDDQPADADALPPELRRQVVAYRTTEPPGTIVIDTAHTFLYLTLGDGKAMRYGIGVGRQGFTWSGVETITRKAEWPDWIPPVEMVARQPYLPRWVAGGPGNPLGARALYLGNTDYRIHGTNDPTTIGHHVSSGCIRLQNADVMDLYQRVGIGTKVVVLPNAPGRVADGRPVDAGDATVTPTVAHGGAAMTLLPSRTSAPRGAVTAERAAYGGVY
jgi:lipoprotein-anchoring transpeptidase ErfK/SrfK